MNRYFSTFIHGTDKIIEKILIQDFPKIQIENLHKDLVIYTTDLPLQELQKIPFFSNTFLLLAKFESSEMQTLDKVIEWATTSKQLIANLKTFSNTPINFRVLFFNEATSISIPKEKLTEIVEDISHSTGWTYSPSQPDNEIWFIIKKEDFNLAGIRLTKKHDYQETLEKGELRPELAYMLNFLSKPKETDYFIDPFCGSGAIPISRYTYFPAKKIIVSDSNIDNLKKKLKSLDHNLAKFETYSKDGFRLKWIQRNSIDKIVTDPPWGEYSDVKELKDRYSEMLTNFSRVLKQDGVIILLVADQEIIQSLTPDTDLEISETHEIYVSGKKAYIMSLNKESI
jgi:tRNA (guanine6-N2)-methyltransferase